VEIAHLSDLHVLWAPGRRGAAWYRFLNKRMVGGLNLALKRSHPVELLEAAVADLRAHPPDHLVVTGDVSNLSLEAEFVRARDLLAQAGLPPERISVIPGNHDAYTKGSFRTRRFERVFAEWLGGPDATWPRVQRNGEVLIVSLSSAVPTPFLTAYGRLDPAQLDRARALLQADAAFKLALVHHPPVQGDGQADRVWRRNLDGRRLLDVCRETGTALVLCGHTHRPFDWREPGGPWVFCAGSTTRPVKAGLGSGATYNRYTIEGGQLSGLIVRGLDPAQGTFVEVDRRALAPAGI
jgi:3',5'-cyclic AMP phosphodiesterase CpdA